MPKILTIYHLAATEKSEQRYSTLGESAYMPNLVAPEIIIFIDQLLFQANKIGPI